MVAPHPSPPLANLLASGHDAGWVAATKVARYNLRMQRSLGINKAVFIPLDKTQLFHEGLHMVLEETRVDPFT